MRDSLPTLVFLIGVSLVVALVMPFTSKSPAREIITANNVSRLGTLARLTGHSQDLSSIAFSLDNQWLASGSVDGTVRLWDIGAALTSGYKNPDVGIYSHILQTSDAMITSVAFSPTNHILAAASADGLVQLWDIDTDALLRAIQAHDDIASSIIFSPDGKIMMSAGYDGAVRLWDTETYEMIAELSGHTGPVLVVRCTADGKLIVSASLDGGIKLWNAETYQLVATLEAPAVQGMNFSAAGSLLAAVSRIPAATNDDGMPIWGVQMWHINHEGTVNVRSFPSLKSPTGPIYDLVFSEDESMLILAEADASLRFLDVTSRREISQRWDHSDQVIGLALSSDGTLLASASLDDSIKLWKVMAN